MQSTDAVSAPSLKQLCFFINHQKWHISCDLDCETELPVFHLQDTHGRAYTTTEFLVEGLDPDFIHTMTQLTAKEQQQLIHQYLQERLDQVTPYQVHVEDHDNKLFIRFGEYGLKGGVKIGEWETGKTEALLFSVGQIGLGIYLSVTGGNSGKFGGQALISSGLATGTYAYQSDEDKKKYKDTEYAKQFGYGLLTGLVTGSLGTLAQGAGKWAKIGWQTLVSAVGSGTSAIASEVFEKRKNVDLKTIGKKTLIGGIGGGTGAVTGTLVHAALTNEIVNRAGEMVNNLMNQFPRYSEEVAASVAFTLKKMAESGLSSGSSKFVTDLCENLEEDPTKKKDLSTLKKEAWQSAIISALISGTITAFEQKQKIQKYNETKSQIEQTQKELEDAKAAKAKSENALQDLQKTLEQSQQNLIEKQKALKLQEQSLHEKKLQQEQVQEGIEKDQQAISEAQKIASTAEQELRITQQALIEAQQQVSQHQQAVSEAQKIASTAEQQLRTVTQTAQEAEQAHTQLVTSIDKDIRHHLKHGYKAKVNGHYTNNEEKIRNAFLQGGTIEWKKGQNRVFGSRETIKMKSSPLMEKYQQAQEHAKQTEQKIQEIQSSINQKQTELKIAEDTLNLQRQSVDQTQTELKAAQEVQLKQTELKIAQNQLRSYQQEIQQTQQDMSDIQGVIKTLEQQTSQFEAKLQEELKTLQEVLSRESGLTNLSKEQQAVIHKAQQDYDKFLHEQAKSYLHLQTDPVSYIEDDCTLQELIPHIVLVQALNHVGAPDHLAMKMFECETEKDRLICYIKGIITPEGVIGYHLQLERREFSGELAKRPHMHWSWNQLVQPNSGGNWEEARIAILEPLSVFENSTYYKPFGVAPYDTLTFGSHHLSNKSILLVPESIVDEARSYLPAFRDQIVPCNGKLRSAVIHTLKACYPETWHICDEKGNLIGETMKYSTGGYNHVTCLRKTDGQVVILLRNEGVERNEGVRTPEEREDIKDLHSTALKDYYKSKRFIGLHIHAVTVWIEDNPYFQALKEFKENHAKVRNHPLFAGSVKDIHGLAQLGVLQALELYHKLLRFDTKTGVIEVVDYYINEAMYADLVSLFYQMYPSANFDLTALDVKMIFTSERVYLLNLLENIKKGLEAKEPSQKEMAVEFFNFYCTKLKQNIISIQQAQEEMQGMISIDKKEIKNDQQDPKVKPSCLLVAQ
ncbi:MAG: hypothetical protein ACRDFB_08245, partial [Rhabdochlamydiaceae bacterium]